MCTQDGLTSENPNTISDHETFELTPALSNVMNFKVLAHLLN